MVRLPSAVLAKIERGGEGLKLLVLRLGALGDILRTLPAVRLVRSGLPRAEICWVAFDSWAGFLERHPDLDGVLAVPRTIRVGLGRPAQPGRAVAEFVRRIRGSGAEVVLDFHGDLKSGLIGLLSGARVRLGFSGPQQREGNRLFTTHRVAPLPRRTNRVERNLHLVRGLGLAVGPVPGAGLPLAVAEREFAREVARTLAGKGRPYAVLAAGASRRQHYKKPPPRLLAAAAQALAREAVVPLLVHGPGEQDDARAVLLEAGGVLRLAPLMDLGQLAALLSEAILFVGGDSGPMHLACAVGCPVVALYGPTDPLVNSPWGVPARLVVPADRTYTGIRRRDRRSGGFEGIAPAQVASAVVELLSSEATTARRANRFVE